MKPITLLLQRSNKLMILLITAGLFFGSMLLLLTLPIGINIILLTLILLSTAYFVMNIALLSLPWSWCSVSINKAGECSLTQKNDESFIVRIQPDSFVSSFLTIIHVVPLEYRWYKIWHHRHIILLQDNADAELFRKLRVYLRWHKNIAKTGANLNALEN